jgi:hypothetical protein
MEGSLTESVQQLVRPGKCVDIYYPDPETASKQCFRTSQNTRYVQTFTNLGQGSNTFVIPPNNGVQDIVLTMGLPTAFTNTGLGVCRGWAYALIKQISFRYGGSSQYFLSGQQVLQAVLSQASNSGSRDAILSLGGNACTGPDFANAQYGYVWLPLPHCIPSSEGKLPPLPSDLLTQQIQITVELFPLSQIFSIGSTGALANCPTSLAVGQFQVQQVLLEDQGNALARRVDMTSHALSYPVTFRQQEVAIQLGAGASITPASAGTQTVTLTGFRSGEVKEIHCWLTADALNTPSQASLPSMQNPFAWYPLENVSMTYAGEVYARGDYNSMQLWNLVNGKIPSQVNDIKVTGTTVPVITTASADAWTILPFGQSYSSPTAHSMYVAGKPITNGIVNLSFTIPKTDSAGNVITASTFTLHVSYVYNAVLTFSQGTCDYVF